MVAPGTDDESIVIKLIAEAEDAIKDLAKFRQDVNTTKAKLQDLAKAHNESFKTIADSIRANLDATAKEGKEAITVLNTALKEVSAERATANRESVRLAKEAAKQEADAVKKAEAAKTAARKANLAEIKQLNQQKLEEEEKAAKKAEEAAKRNRDAWSKAWKAIAVAALLAIRKIIQAFQQAIQEGIEFSKTMFKLAASVRALQRGGMNITFAQTLGYIRELRKEFSFFSTRELTDSIGQIQLLTRNFDFTTKQMKEMMNVATALAVVQGKDVNETARELALFYSSGYAEALQKAGFAVNKLTIEEEARRNGIKKSYRELTEVERAQMAHNLVLRQSADLMEEAGKYADTMAGRYDAAAAKINDSSVKIGESLSFLAVAAQEAKSSVLGFIETAAVAVAQLRVGAMAEAAGRKAAKAAKKRGEDEAKAYAEAYNETLLREGRAAGLIGPEEEDVTDKQATEAAKALKNKFSDALVEARDAIEDLADDIKDELEDAYKDLYDDLGDIVSEGQDGLAEIDANGNAIRLSQFDEFNRMLSDGVDESEINMLLNREGFVDEMGDIDRDGLWDLLEIWNDFFQKLEDIQRKHDEAVADAKIDLQQDLEDLAIDTQRKLEDAARKYREQELKAERDFQAKLRKLREEFLFDLEDALRERDARQVLRLIRRYNLDLQQLKDQYADEKEERKKALEEELADIRRQAEQKRQDLYRDFDRKLADLALQAEREREQAKLDRERARAELLADLEQERKERVTAYKEELQEISDEFGDKIDEIIHEHFGDFTEATNLMAAEIVGTLAKAFGEGGLSGQILENLVGDIQQAVAAEMAAIAELQAARDAIASGEDYWTNPETNTALNSPDLQMASGGTILASKPTTVLMGEAGPEVANFVPLSQMNTTSGPASAAPALESSEAMEGSVMVKIALSDGLVGEIVDISLGETGKIMAEVLQGG